MSPNKPGSLYRIAGRGYVDSQTLLNLASAHEVLQLQGGWSVLMQGGSVRCAQVGDRSALPGQRGALYELSSQGAVSLKAARAAWVSQGLVELRGTFDVWPGSPAVTTGCGCGSTCGCAPCRLRHGHDHHPDETPSRSDR